MKRIALVITILGAAVPAAAAPPPPIQHDVCVNQGFGVPTRGGPPDWWDPPAPAGSGDPSLDDPRWRGATARSFQQGSATATMNVRTVWANDAGQEYLYLSLISDLHPNASTGRDIFIGFHRANPGISGDDTGVTGYVLQVHLNPVDSTASPETAKPIAYCGSYEQSECTDGDPASLGNWWRVFRDFGGSTTQKCQTTSGTVDETGEQFKQWNGTGATPHLVAPFSWLDNFIHAWKLGANTWAIQMRIKIVPTSAASPAPISMGIEKGSTIWYEATETQIPTTTPNMSIGKYPQPETIPPPLDQTMPGRTGVTGSICIGPKVSNNDTLLHPDLSNAQNYSKLSDTLPPPTTPPSDCDTGLTLGNIGAVFNTPPPYDALTPLNQIKALDAAGNPQANTMIAQVINTNPAGLAPISAKVQARFRLANWGAGPIGSDRGEFSDIRGGSAVCMPEGAPPCTAQSLTSGQQMAIHFNWKLGDDGTLGASEYCAYGLMPPSGAGSCAPCTCDGSQPDCATGTPGTGVAGKPCMKIHNPHECMLVELTAPTSDVNFVRASAYNNMNFAEMSTVAREAVIDARKLPTNPGQKLQDIYFFVMPRNMPSTVPAGTTTTSLIQNAAVAKALAVSKPYLADIARLQKDDPAGLQQIIDTLARQRPGQIIAINQRATVGTGDERLAQVLSAMRVMPNDDWTLAGKLLGLVAFSSQSDHPNDDLVHNAVSSLGPANAAELVPTLEIYPFYKAPNDVVYQQMSSFTLFLSHESTLGGVRYEVDGAAKVAENVYHVQIPVGFARKIQVRAQALVGSEPPLPRGNPAWPCAGGCVSCGGVNRNCGLVATIGNTAPGLIAGVFVIRRRRKKQKPAKA